MARNAALKVVSDDDTAESRPSTVHAAAGISRRALLTALRDKIAADIDGGVAARDLASLSRRLMEITKELEGIEAAEDGDDVGDAAATPDEPWSG